jgi:hypothetical protein
MKGGASAQQDDGILEERQEMNELIESEPELYEADVEDYHPKSKKKSLRDKLKADI